ncbi:MAG: DUF4332 domain-containing protein [Fuerstiella sp.]
MRLKDILVERFGVLRNAELCDLSPGLTVVFGGNGSGKTTMVSFLRGLLFGYTTDHQAFQADDERFGGAVCLESHGRSVRLARECSHGISSDLSTIDLATGVTPSVSGAQLPGWVNEPVFQEIFSVGYQEAARFDLLTRLCLNPSGAVRQQHEMRRAEMAAEQCVRERDGNGEEGGLTRNVADLSRQRDDLNRRLADLRRTDPALPARIAATEAELQRLRISLSDIEQKLRDAEAQVKLLEQQWQAAQRRNQVSLDRRAIEEQIALLTERQQRWTRISQSVQRELHGVADTDSAGWQPSDSLQSIRALVTRLEQRMDAILNHNEPLETREEGAGRDLFFQHLRSEVFSLCDYVSQHENAIQAHQVSLEAALAERTLQNADKVISVLQGQIDSLRAEQRRCEDVIAATPPLQADCENQVHRKFRRSRSGDLTVTGSVDALEAQLQAARRRVEDLRFSCQQMAGQIDRLQTELADLQSQRQSAARLEDLDRLKFQIAEVETRLSQLQRHQIVLDQTEAGLRTVAQRLHNTGDRQVLVVASGYISRLTDGDCFGLIPDETGTYILAQTRQAARPQQLQQLSRGTRDLVALALRLALIQCRGEEDERCPLILDDVFVSADDDAAAAAADLLLEVAADGQQIIFFTSQNDVRDVFVRRQVRIRHLEERPAVTLTTHVPPPEPVPSVEIPAAPAVPAATVRSNDHTNWLFYLEVDNPVEDLSGLTVAEIEAFRASGLEWIEELLTLSVDELESRFRNHGYAISRERIRAWRGQAELATQIPMLRRSDAELLYAAGIQSRTELSRMRPETVFDVVTKFQQSPGGARYLRSGRTIDRQQAINWSRWSQHSRSLTEARHSRSRFFVKSGQASDLSAPSDGRSNGGALQKRRARISQSGAVRHRQRRPGLSMEARRQCEQRRARRRQRMARHSSSYRTADAGKEQETERQLKFYLNRSNEVEAAPSIGPRTAQRLGRVGIFTVDDLLNADAEEVAVRLSNQRISGDTILQWQHQARLCCQVPGLRGHDAQILVACGVTEAEQLSAKRPADLYALVGPFANTSEGERIVRGGRKPDLEEVTDWISWAQHSRSLKAAA